MDRMVAAMRHRGPDHSCGFDALSPAHDHPLTMREPRAMFQASPQLTDIQVEYGANGVVGNARRKPGASAEG